MDTKVRCPRFVDHIDLGEKPKYKSFWLRMHREAAAKDESLQKEQLGEPNLDIIPKRMLPHPKKRMQMYQEMDAFDDTSNDGDHTDASRKSCVTNVPNEYPKQHQSTSEQVPYLMTQSCQPHVTSNTSDSNKLRNSGYECHRDNWKSERDESEQNSPSWQSTKTESLSTNIRPHYGHRKESSEFSRLEYSRSNREYNQKEQTLSDSFNLSQIRSHIISESDQDNYGVPESYRFDDSIRNLERKHKNYCSDSLMDYATSPYSPNSHRRVYTPNGAIQFSPKKIQHNVYSKQNLDVFAVNENLLNITRHPDDLQFRAQPQVSKSSSREKFPRVPPYIKIEKKVYTELSIKGHNPQFDRLHGDNHSPTWHRTVPPYPVYPQRNSDNPEDLRLPNSSRLLEELISAVSSRRERELPQLVPSRPTRTKHLSVDEGASQEQHGHHRKRPSNGDVEPWQHERRRDQPGHRSSVEAPYPIHHSAFHPTPHYQPPTVPYPRSSPGGAAPYPPPPAQHGYGYSPPGSYPLYPREEPQAPPTAPPPAPPPLSARDKTISWLSGSEPLCPSPPRVAGAPTTSSSSFTENKEPVKKVDDYKVRPMSEWKRRDVAHFLIEATHDLGIRYENTNFSQLHQVDGRKLLSMEPKQFEKFTPTEGQRVYDYVRRHRNHEVLTKEGQNENYHSDSHLPSIVTPPPLSDGSNVSSMFPSDVYADYPSIQHSPTLNGSMSYDLQGSSVSGQPFPGPGNSSAIPVGGSMGPPIPPDSIPLNPYQNPGMMPSHSSAGYPPPCGSMFPSTSDHYQYPPNSVASGSHMRPNVAHLSAENYPTAANKTFYPLHDPSAMYPSSETADDRDRHMGMRHEEGRHPHEAERRQPPPMFPDFSEQEESSDDDEEEDEEEEEEEEEVIEKPPEPPKKRGPGRPPKPESERKKKKRTGRLWEFIRNLLLNPETCPSIVKWEDAEAGVFRFVQSEKVAEKWGMRKNNQKMNYEKLSRAMRYYYKGKVFEPVLGRRLVYKFGANAKGWKPNNANFGQ